MVTFPINSQQIPATDQPISTTISDQINEVVLGHGTKENLVFEWNLSEWTDCSETCGGSGIQVRTAR